MVGPFRLPFRALARTCGPGLGYTAAVTPEHVTIHLDADAGVLWDLFTLPSDMPIAPPMRSWRKGCEEVSYSSIGSSGFIESGVGGRVAMNCKEAASPMPVPHTWGTRAVFQAWAMAAIFLHSVKPPEEQRSGWRMSRAPSEIHRRKPVYPNRFSPAARWVSVRFLRALYPSRSSCARGSSKKWTPASRHPRRILRVAGAS